MHTVAVAEQKNPADLRPVLALQTLLGDGDVIVDLALQNGADILNVDRVGKLDNMLDRQQLSIFRNLNGVIGEGLFQYDGVILPDADHIGMMADDVHVGAVAAFVKQNREIEGLIGVGLLQGDIRRPEIGIQAGKILFRCIGDDLELLLGLPEAETGSDRRAQALPAAGVGHDNALYVFDGCWARQRSLRF